VVNYNFVAVDYKIKWPALKKKANKVAGKVRRQYGSDQTQAAIAAVRTGMPFLTASKRYGVPRIILRNKVKEISPEECSMGPPTILTAEEEQRIVTWIIDIAHAGFSVTRRALVDSVAKIIRETNRKTPFIDGSPGKKWYSSFVNRHPEIYERTPEKLSGYRSQITEADIRKWFNEVLDYLKENNYDYILEEPSRIF
jgi:hypothetical protein